jgi:hypothetical protein
LSPHCFALAHPTGRGPSSPMQEQRPCQIMPPIWHRFSEVNFVEGVLLLPRLGLCGALRLRLRHHVGAEAGALNCPRNRRSPTASRPSIRLRSCLRRARPHAARRASAGQSTSAHNSKRAVVGVGSALDRLMCGEPAKLVGGKANSADLRPAVHKADCLLPKRRRARHRSRAGTEQSVFLMPSMVFILSLATRAI